MSKKEQVENTLKLWQEKWPEALRIWSDYVKLRVPEWCMDDQEAQAAGMRESFAMIRLNDHRIVIDMQKVVSCELENCALQILAHEIGHHIYTPANLKDNAEILSKVRWSMAGIEDQAPMVANLYEDLLINDRLQRNKGLDMALVYRKINKGVKYSTLWTLYMRTYEYLWKLKRGELAGDVTLHTEAIDADASLIASMIRSYSKNWLEGAARFGAMLYPYLLEEKEAGQGRQSVLLILDSEEAGKDGGIVTGMAEIPHDAIYGIIDPRKEALGATKTVETIALSGDLANKMCGVGPEQRYLNPGVYVDLLLQVNPNAKEQEVINNYYKEIALPYLINFPVDINNSQSHTLPEGTELWEFGDSVDEIDWVETAIYAAEIFPGINTLKRIFGPTGDNETTISALNVYIGVDCSGSMVNPGRLFSWPVLAATIIGLSALRAGAKVMACLSGEPGSFLQNDNFISHETDILTVLTSYLGTGYGFGIARFKEPFARPLDKKAHVIMVTDDDLFHMLGATTDNGDDHWEIIEYALNNAGGSGTIVLHSKKEWHSEQVQRLRGMGWHIHYVTNQEQLLTFASEFTKTNY